MEYFVFVQDDQDMEKIVASSPSLEIARKTAQRMANADRKKYRRSSSLRTRGRRAA